MSRNRCACQQMLAIVLLGAWAGPVQAGWDIKLSLDAASVPVERFVDAGSMGRDEVDRLLAAEIPGVFFSVDRVAVGAAGTPIYYEARPPIESAHGDIYYTTFNNSHVRVRQEVQLGLDPGFLGDDIDALDMTPIPGPDVVSINVVFPFDSLWRNCSKIKEPAWINGDGEDPDGLTPDDITLGVSNLLFASGVIHIGLFEQDDLDALLLMDVTPDPSAPGGFRREPNYRVDPGFDLAIFSLDPFSPHTVTGGGGPYWPGDLFVTAFTGSFGLWKPAPTLGLRYDDNVDALAMIPEPHSGLCLVLTWLLVRRRASRSGRVANPSFRPSREE